MCRLQGALSNYGYRWGWFAIGCIFQVLIVAGLLLTGAARQACSAVQLRCLRTGDRDWQLSTELLYIVSSGSDARCPGIYLVSCQGIQWVQAWGLASLSSK